MTPVINVVDDIAERDDLTNEGREEMNKMIEAYQGIAFQLRSVRNVIMLLLVSYIDIYIHTQSNA